MSRHRVPLEGQGRRDWRGSGIQIVVIVAEDHPIQASLQPSSTNTLFIDVRALYPTELLERFHPASLARSRRALRLDLSPTGHHRQTEPKDFEERPGACPIAASVCLAPKCGRNAASTLPARPGRPDVNQVRPVAFGRPRQVLVPCLPCSSRGVIDRAPSREYRQIPALCRLFCAQSCTFRPFVPTRPPKIKIVRSIVHIKMV